MQVPFNLLRSQALEKDSFWSIFPIRTLETAWHSTTPYIRGRQDKASVLLETWQTWTAVERSSYWLHMIKCTHTHTQHNYPLQLTCRCNQRYQKSIWTVARMMEVNLKRSMSYLDFFILHAGLVAWNDDIFTYLLQGTANLALCLKPVAQNSQYFLPRLGGWFLEGGASNWLGEKSEPWLTSEITDNLNTTSRVRRTMNTDCEVKSSRFGTG